MLNRLIERLGGCLAAICTQVHTALESAIAGPRLLVAVGIACAAGDFVGCYLLSFWWLVAAGLAGVACAWAQRRWKVALVLLLLPAVSYAYCLFRTPRPDACDLSKLISRGQVIFRARVIADLTKPQPDLKPQSRRLLLSCEKLVFPTQRNLSGRTILTVRGALCQAKERDEIEVTTRVMAPSPVQQDWDFDYKHYLSRQGIFSTCSSVDSQVKVLSAGASSGSPAITCVAALEDGLSRLRSHLTAVHRRFAGQPEGDLLQSMVLGDRTVSLPPEITQKFRDLGLSHILAASGFNITVVTGVTWWLGRFFLRPVWAVNLGCFCSMLLYVGLAGPSPSVVRAALMCCFVLLSRCLFRALYVPSALALALLLTLAVDPLAIADVGLQLSYAATAGIICGAGRLSAQLKMLGPVRIPDWLGETLSVVLVAQASVLPIQLAYFWQIGLFFLPANLIVTPIVTVVTILGFVSSALVMIDFSGFLTDTLVRLMDGLSVYPLRLMLAAVDFLSSYEEARLRLGPPMLWTILVYYAALVLLWASLRTKHLRLTAVTFYGLALFCLLWRPAPAALTLASFPQCVILLDGCRQTLCVGDAGAGGAARFLLYSGARVKKEETSCLRAVKLNPSVLALESTSPPARVLIIDGGAALVMPEPVPASAAVIVTGPPEPQAQKYLAGSQCALPYSGGAPNAPAILEIVKQSGCHWALFSGRSGRFSRQLNYLERNLHEISGLNVLRSGRQAFMLIANYGNQGSLEFRQVMPAVSYDSRAQIRN